MKRIIQTLCLSLGVIALAHCSGNDLIDDSDPNLSGPVAALSVATVHHLHDGSALAADEMGVKTLENDLGYTIVLEEAAINWKSLLLISSGDDPECEGGNDSSIELESSEDFLAEDLVANILTEQEIAQVSYCSWRLTLAPGAEDAHLKNHGGEDHGSGVANPPIDETFHLTGTWSDGGAPVEFHLHSTEALILEGAFQATQEGETIQHPLHFHEGEIEKQVMFGVKYDVLLTGLDFAAQTEEESAAQVRENLGLAVHQHLAAPASH